MQVLKVELAGMTTSFRYPHFLVGRQPSLPLPPPATIYGHISSALGGWPDPASLRFGYTFTHGGAVDDLESQHIVGASSGKFKNYPKNLEGNINPTYRQVLIQPRLTLYLTAPDLESYKKAFRQPRYAVVLGRSQDLATYTEVNEITLEQSENGYFEGTILPGEFRDRTNAGVLIQMPRFINPQERREVDWEMYMALEKRIFTSADQAVTRRGAKVWNGPANEGWLVDPTSPLKDGLRRIVYLHDFTGEGVVL